MELTLFHLSQNLRVAVEINGEESHTFSLMQLLPDEARPDAPPQPLEEPVVYGQAVFGALFPQGSLAATQLTTMPERLSLVTEDELLQAHRDLLLHCAEAGIEAAFAQLEESQSIDLPFPQTLPSQTVSALLGTPQEKMDLASTVQSLANDTDDPALSAFFQAIQTALFGGDLRQQLGARLEGVYEQAWLAILVGVETEGIGLELFEALANNTLAVLGSEAEQKSALVENIQKLQEQATQDDKPRLANFVAELHKLLLADGDPSGLGTELAGIHAEIWEQLLSKL